VGVRKPILLAHLKSYAEKNYVVYVEDNLEGDDLLGLYSNPNTIICSIDKDLKTIPGKHYNFGKDEFYDVSEEEADYNHLFQTLTGDATDGYPGCPGCGPKTAEKILAKSCGWEAVQTAYNKQGLSEEEALTQARVARILRPGEFDFDTNTVKLWSPNE
jgi:DNA polymerase-1